MQVPGGVGLAIAHPTARHLPFERQAVANGADTTFVGGVVFAVGRGAPTASHYISSRRVIPFSDEPEMRILVGMLVKENLAELHTISPR